MAIFSRIADILKANINDMIDKAEDPEKMVKQLIIEIEQDVDEATQALGQAMGSQKMAQKELADALAKSAAAVTLPLAPHESIARDRKSVV